MEFADEAAVLESTARPAASAPDIDQPCAVVSCIVSGSLNVTAILFRAVARAVTVGFMPSATSPDRSSSCLPPSLAIVTAEPSYARITPSGFVSGRSELSVSVRELVSTCSDVMLCTLKLAGLAASPPETLQAASRSAGESWLFTGLVNCTAILSSSVARIEETAGRLSSDTSADEAGRALPDASETAEPE